MPPRHPDIARALGSVRAALNQTRAVEGLDAAARLGLVVACSGGRDSVALLGLLGLMARADALALTVGHVDHGLRAGSQAEAEHVEELAARLGVPFVQTRLSLDPLRPGVPARARQARHDALSQMRRDAGAHRIALAHTATDQAETVLLHLSRGAGLRGLAGMAVVEPGAPIVRPLLALPRGSTGPLCGHLQLPFVDDPGNTDVRHPRIRIRTQVLPELGAARGGVEAALAASARAAAEADQALDVWATRECTDRAREDGWYDLSAWAGLPRAIRVRVLQRICAHAGVAPGTIGRRALDAIDQGVCAGGSKRWPLPGRVQIETAGRRLRVRTSPEKPT